ncbi:MAG: hypothetical protein KF709_10065 [Gemmatimonadaceae bacterium]|nr:hypothetical protein [Gemmatimonadaceae bacterium]
MSHAPDIALLTDRRYLAEAAAADDWYLGNILRDDALLMEGLAAEGLSAQRVDWADPSVDWSQFRAAVFRSTWDYFDRFEEFSAWLRRAEQATQLLNVPETIWWNLDKHYLDDLGRRGVPTVPSVFIEAGDPRSLQEVLDGCGWSEAVIKPCVSGAARHTHRVSRVNAAAVGHTLAALRAEEAFILQPFVPSILTEGELTLVVIDGLVTHAVRKRARPGDFRVQDDHGGTWIEVVPSAEEIAFAERAMAAVSPRPIYGRVDLVRDPDGALQVMELELIEPELWLRTHPAAAQRMARAVAARVNRG